MAEIPVSSILDLFKDLIIKVFGFLKRQVSYPFNYDSKVQKLQGETEALKNKTEELQKSVDEAKRKGDEIYEHVSNWLSSSGIAIREAEGVINEKEEIVKQKCFIFIPDLKARRRFSRKAENKAFVIDELISKQATFTSISYRLPPKQITPSAAYDGEGLKSRESLLKQVTDALLEETNHRIIGVYGTGGVGKTTLAKQVQRKVDLDKSFDVVVFVAVSEQPNISKIQEVIAGVLDLPLSGDDVLLRANQLCKRLKDEKRKLIILDDVWEKLNFDELGIPSASGDNCKILLTSRCIDICKEIGAKKNFPIDVLSEEEAWSLFKKTVLGGATETELPPTAKDIANKCAGLPLLIELVAKELKNSPPHWEDMLERLSNLGDEKIGNQVYKVLERSYKNLDTDEAKSFFLLCSLFGQANIEIEDLVRCSVGLGLLKGVQSIAAARNRVYRLIGNLKTNSLLLEGDMDGGFVKIHDIVRDTARSIASKEQHAILKISEFEEKEKLECTRISLSHSTIDECLPQKLECPKAELLMVEEQSFGKSSIPERFFEGITELKVVHLRGFNLNPLPFSFSGLTNIRTLSLSCKLGGMATIGYLNKLEVLSLYSSIFMVPRAIGQLARLKLLDLSQCGVEHFPANLLSKLSMLEELYLMGFRGWDSEGNVSVSELESLPRLSTLEAQIPHFKVLPKFQLKKYNLKIGDSSIMSFGLNFTKFHETTKSLHLSGKRSIVLADGLKVMLREAKILLIERNPAANDFIEHIIDSSDCELVAFPFLEVLYLTELNRLLTICDCELAQGSFNNLRILQVISCYSLTNLFPLSSATCLPQLQDLVVRKCENVEYIFSGKNADNSTMEMVQFPRLTSLKLCFLRNLKGFCESMYDDISLSLFDGQVSFPKLSTLEVKCCDKLKHLFTISFLQSIKELESLQVSLCDLMEEIILAHEFAVENNIIIFPQLKSLTFDSMPNLKRLCTGYLIDIQSLTKLKIQNCYELVCFTESLPFNEMAFDNLEELELDGKSMLRSNICILPLNRLSKLKIVTLIDLNEYEVRFLNVFKNLETLEVAISDSIRVLFSQEELLQIKQAFQFKHLKLSCLRDLEHIWAQNSQLEPAYLSDSFQNLSKLSVQWCRKLSNIFTTVSMAAAMINLTEMVVSECRMMTEVVGKDADDEQSKEAITFQKLKSLQLKSLHKLRSFCSTSQLLHFPSLEQVTVERCPRMKTFNEGSLRTPKLHRVICDNREEWINGDLNATIETRWKTIVKKKEILEKEKGVEGSSALPTDSTFDKEIGGMPSTSIVGDLNQI